LLGGHPSGGALAVKTHRFDPTGQEEVQLKHLDEADAPASVRKQGRPSMHTDQSSFCKTPKR